MATISKPFLHPITGNDDDPAWSVIKVDYTVTFDAVDLALNQPYRVLARVYGDDTNVSGDGAGGVDEHSRAYRPHSQQAGGGHVGGEQPPAGHAGAVT